MIGAFGTTMLTAFALASQMPPAPGVAYFCEVYPLATLTDLGGDKAKPVRHLSLWQGQRSEDMKKLGLEADNQGRYVSLHDPDDLFPDRYGIRESDSALLFVTGQVGEHLRVIRISESTDVGLTSVLVATPVSNGPPTDPNQKFTVREAFGGECRVAETPFWQFIRETSK